jgi:hypothetical protein
VSRELWRYVRRPGPRFVELPTDAASFLLTYVEALAASTAREGIVEIAELLIDTLEGSLDKATFRRHRLERGRREWWRGELAAWRPSPQELDVLGAIIARRLAKLRAGRAAVVRGSETLYP